MAAYQIKKIYKLNSKNEEEMKWLRWYTQNSWLFHLIRRSRGGRKTGFSKAAVWVVAVVVAFIVVLAVVTVCIRIKVDVSHGVPFQTENF